MNVIVKLKDCSRHVVKGVERISTTMYYHRKCIELITAKGEEVTFEDIHSLEVLVQ